MDENPELAAEIARGLSYQVCVLPCVMDSVFLRQERWPSELQNLDMEILTQYKHLDPIIQFTDHVDFPDGFKFVWLATIFRCWWGLIGLRTSLWKLFQYFPIFSSRLRSGSVCVVPLLNLCCYDGKSQSAFTRIADIMVQRNLVEIAEPFLEATVNHVCVIFSLRTNIKNTSVNLIYLFPRNGRHLLAGGTT